MNKEDLEREHCQLKERLAELVNFINSEDYYQLSDFEKHLITTQRSGMETYINALSLRLWGKNDGTISMPSMLPLLMSMMMPSFSSPSSLPTEESQKR